MTTNTDPMTKKQDKTKHSSKLGDKGILAIVFSFAIILVFTLIWFQFQVHLWEYSYVVEIRSSNSGNYTLIVPVAMKNETEISKIMSEVKVLSGQATIALIDTPYGKGLRIEGNQTITTGFTKYGYSYFSVPKENEIYRITNVSMWKNLSSSSHGFANGEVWIYSYSKSWTQNISYSLSSYWTIGNGLEYQIHSNKIISKNNWQDANCSVVIWGPA